MTSFPLTLELGLCFRVFLGDGLGHFLFVVGEPHAQAGIGRSENLHGKKAGVGRAPFIEGHGGYRDARGHLYGGEQGIHAAKRRGRERHGDDGQRGKRGAYAGQVGRTTGRGDDHLDAAIGGGAGEIVDAVRRAMRRGHFDFKTDAKLLQHLGGFDHGGQIAIRPHDDGYLWSFSGHIGSLSQFFEFYFLDGVTLTDDAFLHDSAQHSPSAAQNFLQAGTNIVHQAAGFAAQGNFNGRFTDA